jgi:hypothetical protein
MSARSRFRRGYLYRIFRKASFLLKRGTFFRSSGSVTTSRINRGKKFISPSTFFKITLNSTFIFLFSYVLVFFIVNLASALTAYAFNIPTILYYYNIEFVIKGVGWSPDAVKVVYSTAPLVALLLAVFMLIVYNKVTEETGILKLVILWMALQALAFSFGEIMMGALFSRGFGYVLMYLYINDTFLMLITVFAMITMAVLGVVFSRMLIISANIYFNDLPTFYIRKYLASQFLIPFLLGNAVIVALKMPRITAYEICFNLSMIFLLLPAIIRMNYPEDFRFDEDPRRIRLYPLMIAATMILVAGYRVLLDIGLRLF